MRKAFLVLFLLAISIASCAQQSATNPPNQGNLQFSATRYEFDTFTLVPAGAYGATLQNVGNVGLGPQTIYYWIAVTYQVGNAALSGPYVIQTAPATLNSSNYVTINARIPDGAITFDVLKTSGPLQPFGACNCAVATGVSPGTIVNDQSNSTSSYTVANFDLNVLKHTMTLEVVGSGDAHVILRKNGVFVCDLDIGCGGGGGGITSFSAGDLPPLFTTTVTNPTTTPHLAFNLTNAGGNTYYGNLSNSSGPPSFLTWPACANDGTHALVYVNGTGVQCQPITHTCGGIGLGDGVNAIAAATYPIKGCANEVGPTWSVLKVKCFTDNAGSSTLDVKNNAGTSILTGPVTCSNSGNGATATLSGSPTIASGDSYNFVFISDGSSKSTTWTVTWTE